MTTPHCFNYLSQQTMNCQDSKLFPLVWRNLVGLLEVVFVVDTPTSSIAQSNAAKPTFPMRTNELLAGSAILALCPFLELSKLMAHKTLASVATFEPHRCVPPCMVMPQNFIRLGDTVCLRLQPLPCARNCVETGIETHSHISMTNVWLHY